MAYIKLSTLEYPRHIGDIWLEHPELDGQYICPETYAEVEFSEPPSDIDSNKQFFVQDNPIQENEKWKMTLKVIDYTQAELDAFAQAQAELNAQMQNEE